MFVYIFLASIMSFCFTYFIALYNRKKQTIKFSGNKDFNLLKFKLIKFTVTLISLTLLHLLTLLSNTLNSQLL